MTSKNLFFNLMKEDAKRRAWVFALITLALFFSLPIAVATMTGDNSWYSDDQQLQLIFVTSEIKEWLSAGNLLMIFLMFTSSILCSFSGYSYMNSKKKVDFYHSIPVKRKTLFAVYYVNGILMMLVSYGVNLLITLALAAVNGIDMSILAPAAWTGFGIHMLGFLIMYATASAAVLLTGNIIIGFLGSMVFFFYGPIVSTLTDGYFRTWFRTYGSFGEFSNSSENGFLSFMMSSSPLNAYMDLVEESTQLNNNLAGMILGTVAATAALTVLALLIHQKRPSESAGKAMAFVRLEPVIKILVVIPAALAGGLIFWGFRSTFGWSIFGVICTAVILHCIIEIIYHFDFKKLFTNLPHMGICLAVSLLILFGFKYDLLGYDTYKPKSSSVESVAIDIDRLDTWVTYGSAQKIGQEERRSASYRWSYSYLSEYAFNNMALTELDEVMELVDAGIVRNNQIKNGEQDQYSEDDGSLFSTVNVLYRLKSGRKVVRCYYIPLNQLKGSLDRLYLKPAYKDGVFPLFIQLPENTAAVNYQEQNHITSLELGKEYGNENEMIELLGTYKEELKSLSLESRSMESPIGTIQFMDKEHAAAVDFLKEHRDSNRYDLEQRCYYPVYPSFEKTIALLKKYGVQPGQEVTAERADEITISDREYRRRIYQKSENIPYPEADYDSYMNDEADEEDVTIHSFTDPDQIQAIMSALIPKDYADMNPLNQTDYYSDITVIVGSGSKKQEYLYALDIDKMPEFLKQALNFSNTRKYMEYKW